MVRWLGGVSGSAPKSYYTNGNYGFGSYPENAQRLGRRMSRPATCTSASRSDQNDGDGTCWQVLVLICAGIGGEQLQRQPHLSPTSGDYAKTRDSNTISTYFMVLGEWPCGCDGPDHPATSGWVGWTLHDRLLACLDRQWDLMEVELERWRRHPRPPDGRVARAGGLNLTVLWNQNRSV